jgi:hypothetical protein
LTSLILSGNLNTNANIVTNAGDISAAGNITGGNLVTAGLMNAGTLTVTGVSNLGAIGNVTITGGSPGYLLQTDGSGALSWVTAPSGSSIANGTSNISIPSINGNVNTSVGGTANVLVVTATGANISGTLNASGNANVGNIGTGALVATGAVVSSGTVTAIGLNIVANGVGTQNILIGNGYANTSLSQTIDIAGNLTGSGGSRVTILANASGSGQPNVSIGSNVTGANGIFTIGAFANTANTVTIGLGTNASNGTINIGAGSGSSNATAINVGIGNATTGNVSTGLGTVNIGIGNNQSGSTVTTIVNVGGNVTGANSNTVVRVASNITNNANSKYTVEIGNSTANGTIKIGGSSNTTTSFTGNVTFTSGSTLTVNANIQGSNVYGTNNVRSGGNFIMTAANSYLITTGNGGIQGSGYVANVILYAGLFDDALGGYSTRTINIGSGLNDATATSQINIGSSVGNSAITILGNVTVTNGNLSGSKFTSTVATGTAPLIVTSTTRVANLNVATAGVADSVAVANVSGIGNIATINKDGNASNILYGNGVFASAPVTYSNSDVATFLSSYGSNTITTTGNVSFGNIDTTGLVGAGSLTVTGTTNLGAVGNVTITGGTSGQFLKTDGSGALSWANSAGGSITNDTTTNASYYVTFTDASSGSLANVGVSTTKLYFNPSTGQLNATDFNSLSDKVTKTNIKQLENTSNIISLLTGVSFDWVDGTGSSYGFIAQDIEPVLPHAVSTNSEGKKSVNYSAVIPFLVETIKEQKQEIEALKASTRSLETSIEQVLALLRK